MDSRKQTGAVETNGATKNGSRASVIEQVRYHLAMSEVTYKEHLTFAVRASGLLAYASVASIVHAFMPALFPATAARIVIHLYKQRLEDHPNPKYQEMMRSHGVSHPPQSEGEVAVRSSY